MNTIILFLMLTGYTWLSAAPRVLHLTFHRGCEQDFAAVAQKLNLELTSIFVQSMPPGWLDGITTGNSIYNITHELADRAFKKHKDFFAQFDVIITSDTAPLSRIFIQNNWKKPLIIWVCNRFDYRDGATAQGKFPDPEYYALFKKATKMPNIRIVAYTPFETFYAHKSGIDIGNTVIKPYGSIDHLYTTSSIPAHIDKKNTFFIPPYLNDTKYQNVAQKCAQLGIPVYCGRYNGPADLKDFKGIIHLPYAWSNLALFENMQLGIPYFIPSEHFILQLARTGPYFFNHLSVKTIHLSEWYCAEHRDLFVYFDSWQDLAHKVATTNFEEMRTKVTSFATQQRHATLLRWQNIFHTLGVPCLDNL